MKEERVKIEKQRKDWDNFLKTDTGKRHIQRMHEQIAFLENASEKSDSMDKAYALMHRAAGVKSELFQIERLFKKNENKSRVQFVKDWKDRLMK